MMIRTLLGCFLAFCGPCSVSSFSPTLNHGRRNGGNVFLMKNGIKSKNMPSVPSRTRDSKLGMFFADSGGEEPSSAPTTKEATPPPPPPSNIDFVASNNEGFLNMVGAFLVDSFWLNSPHHRLGDTARIDETARMSLIVEQASDLQEKHGEVMGTRLLDSIVIAALDKDTKSIVGAVTLKVTLLDKKAVLEGEDAEVTCRNAVASLGPKQRRQYKGAPVDVIASELLGPDTKTVCVLSNLAVSPAARRRGIARALCDEAEAVAAQDWGFSEMHLLVEKENEAARTLYETKLGYNLSFEIEGEIAIRADIESGEFTETEADTLVLVKKI